MVPGFRGHSNRIRLEAIEHLDARRKGVDTQMKKLLQPTLVMKRDGKIANRIYMALTVLVALAMLAAASGSGSGSHVTAQPLPAWVDVAANVLSLLIGVLVLLPRTRVLGSMLAVVNMLLSMVVNYTVDGMAYYAKVSPFNVTTIMVASILVGHYADDLPNLFNGLPAVTDKNDD